MKLGVSKDEVILVPYDPQWKTEFLRMQDSLVHNTSIQPHQIEHIGSTSIEGIQAKPIIDIIVGVESLILLDKEFFKALQKIGFYRLQVERPNEIVCAKFTNASFETKTHFMHIVEIHQEKWRQMLFFRDYLNAHEETKREYESIKHSFFKSDLQGIQAYTDYKEQFVQSIFSKLEDQ